MRKFVELINLNIYFFFHLLRYDKELLSFIFYSFIYLFFTLTLLQFFIILRASNPLHSEPGLKETVPLAWEKETDVNGLL